MKMLLKKLFSVECMVALKDRKGDLPSSKEIYSSFMKMAWPSALESVLVGLVGTIDTIMVGGIGAQAIAAVGITNQPKFILLAMIFSLNVGVTAIVARRKGENDYHGANSCLKQCLIISLVLSFIMAILGFVFAKPILLFAGAKSDYIGYAIAFFRILMISIVFTSISLTINAAQRGAGNTKISLRTNLCANTVNLILNFFLINGIWFFPKLGVQGAAIATVIGSMVGCTLSIRSLFYRAEFLEMKSKTSWKFDKKTIKGIISISGSAMVEQVFMRIGFFTYAKIVAGLGMIAFATHQICMNIINISFSFGDGLAVSASSLVGQSLGAKRPDLARIYGKTGQRISFGISTVLFLIFVFARKFLVGLFSSDPQIIALGAIIMIIIAFTTHIQTSQVVVSGCLRGAGDTKFVALTSFISVAVIRPLLSWVLCFPCGWGLIGAWIGLFIDQAMRLLLNFARFNSGKWTKIKV
ncbi:MATE family efflux transporter [Paludicola sp. MB14-C6]|uniref:MATE family efflux transporter n=1 Tax=Paludihabitans sp. MB14-C6 TaxID=3070656 RepID=UPI0027DD9DD3|nr:MATE family efflux transporter [Paludicola sp. MB14-C6]WMJ24194.1 MATE family efflux transporter [Paludicola sp. MB14-C6]